MTEEKFRKSLIVTGIIGTIAIILVIVLGIFVFSDSEKSTSIFENEEQKTAYKDKVKENNSSNISEEEVKEINDSNEFEVDESIE